MKRYRWGTAATFVAALAYFLLFRTYGFLVEDEGTLFFELDRVVRGQSPYLDFATGYTPGFFATGAWLLDAVGYSVVALRVVMALVNAGVAASLYSFSRRLVGPWMAGIAPALWVAFIPVQPGQFASFNVPYPAWFATAGWIAVAAAMLAWSKRGGLAWLGLAGAAAAAVFSIKLNGGAYALAGCTWIVATMARSENRLDRVSTVIATSVMALGVWFAFGFALSGQDVVIHLIAGLVIVVLALGYHAHRFATADHPRALPALFVLGLGFAVPTAVWAVPLFSRLGAAGFERDVLLIGSGAAELYYSGHPPPEPYALLVTVALAAAALGGYLVARGRVRPLILLAGGALAMLVGLPFAASSALMPEGLLESIASQLQNSAFWLAPLANVSAVALLAGIARRHPREPATRYLAVLSPLAVVMYLQLYPRTDFMHVIIAVPLTVVIGVVLLDRIARWWAAGRWPRICRGQLWVGTAVAVLVGAVVAIKLALYLPGVSMERATLPGGRLAGIGIEADSADDLRAFAMTADYLEEHTDAGEAVLTFPAVAGVLFAAGRTSPVPHDYWYPGRPDHDDERAMLELIVANPPRYVVTLNDGWTFFIDSPEYFSETRRFVRDNYRLVARYGRYDVLARRDVDAEPVPRLWQPRGPRQAAIEPRLAPRRQATLRWMADIDPTSVPPESLPDEPRQAVLLLRALRDAGDMRAAGLMIAGLRSTDARVRREALGAMDLVTSDFWAALNRWSGDLPLDEYRSFVSAYQADARDLVTHPDDRVVAFASSILRIIDGNLGDNPSINAVAGRGGAS